MRWSSKTADICAIYNDPDSRFAKKIKFAGNVRSLGSFPLPFYQFQPIPACSAARKEPFGWGWPFGGNEVNV